MTWTGVHDFKQINGVLVSTAFDWSQSPGGTLAIGSNTVTLSPCPSGISGTNSNHYLYISGGVGAAEAVLITGGTCTSGATSGTIQFTATDNHSGAWQIGSATAGIQEAVQALPNQGGAVYLSAGIHRLKQTITVGDGTSSSVSTLRGVHLFGEGMGPHAAEITTTGVTQLLWEGPLNGTMLRFAGPIAGVSVHDFMLDGAADVAGTGLEAVHAHKGRFRDITVTRINSVGVDITAHASGPFAIGAGLTTWEGIDVGVVPDGIVGFRIGSNDFGTTNHLDIARNMFIRCEVLCNASDTTGIGFLIRFADALTFIAPVANFCTEGIRFDPPDAGSPPLSRDSFPNGLLFINAIGATPTWDPAWTGNKNVWFLPLLQEEDGFGTPQPAFPDIKGVGGFGSNGGWILDNTADQVALKVRGHSTQNEKPS